MDMQGTFIRSGIKSKGVSPKNGRAWTLYEAVVNLNGQEKSLTFFGPKPLMDTVFNTAPGSMCSFSTDPRGNLTALTVIGGPAQQQPNMPSYQQPPQTMAPVQSQPKNYQGKQSPGSSGGFREPDEINRTEALGIAVRHYGDLMNNVDKLAKAVKKTETLETLQLGIFEMAEKAFKFIKGKLPVADPSSSTTSLGPPAHVDQPDVPAANLDDDVPY